jgi:IS30 family transposase
VQDSPEQIAGRLPVVFPHDSGMRISHEAIYQAIYVRPVGQLRRQMRSHLRTGRTARRPRATRTRGGLGRAGSSTRSASTTVRRRSKVGWYPAITKVT